MTTFLIGLALGIPVGVVLRDGWTMLRNATREVRAKRRGRHRE